MIPPSHEMERVNQLDREESPVTRDATAYLMTADEFDANEQVKQEMDKKMAEVKSVEEKVGVIFDAIADVL
jgi:hypothetical protein